MMEDSILGLSFGSQLGFGTTGKSFYNIGATRRGYGSMLMLQKRLATHEQAEPKRRYQTSTAQPPSWEEPSDGDVIVLHNPDNQNPHPTRAQAAMMQQSERADTKYKAEQPPPPPVLAPRRGMPSERQGQTEITKRRDDGLFDANLRSDELRREFLIDKRRNERAKVLAQKQKGNRAQPRKEWNDDVTTSAKGLFGNPPPVRTSPVKNTKPSAKRPAVRPATRPKPKPRPKSNIRRREGAAQPWSNNVARSREQQRKSNSMLKPRAQTRGGGGGGGHPNHKHQRGIRNRTQDVSTETMPLPAAPPLPQSAMASPAFQIAREDLNERIPSKVTSSQRQSGAHGQANEYRSRDLDEAIARALAAERRRLDQLVEKLVKSQSQLKARPRVNRAAFQHERLSHRVGYRAGIEQAGNAKRDVQANGELVLELEKLMAREEAIRKKWQHELASPTVSAGAKGLTGTSDLCESLHKANDENEERHAKERTRPAEGSAHPSTSTNIGSREERTELSSRVAEEIMQGRRSFLKHRELVEAPLHGTGMSQHQIIESIADLMFEGSLQEIALEVLGTCDEIAEAVFESV